MLEHIKKQLNRFFPTHAHLSAEIEEMLDNGDILADPVEILPYLQTALFDEKVLEVELDGIPLVYFSRLKDDVPGSEEGEEDVLEELDYKEGDYLTHQSHILTLPLEPGLGNLHLRNSECIILRMFINTFAVELATTFENLTKVGDLPVLRLSYPSLARKVHNAREFRAKVPESLNCIVSIDLDEELPELDTVPADISINGMAFSVSKTEQQLFRPGTAHALKLFINDELLAVVNGIVRHLSKVRKKNSIQYVCGVEFQSTSRHLAAAIESIVASVQRAHLKELAEKSYASGIDLIT